MLFTGPGIGTMVHGIALGGAALLGLAASLFYLYAAPPAHGSPPPTSKASPALARLMTLTAIALWLAVIAGTYVVFPPYRATPPAGTTDLTPFPRALLQANAETAWLHAFAMESKEHVPWIASMLATAVAFVCRRHGSELLTNRAMRDMTMLAIATCLVLVSFVSLMGVFINKVAPVQ